MHNMHYLFVSVRFDGFGLQFMKIRKPVTYDVEYYARLRQKQNPVMLFKCHIMP